MAEIRDEHVEWRVVDRLRELLTQLPDSPHDVTLTYSLFSTIVCWTCQRIRAKDHAGTIWQALSREMASDADWGLVSQIKPVGEGAGADLTELPVDRFLLGLRNAVAHGDDRKIRPWHAVEGHGPNHRLIGFNLSVDFFDEGQSHKKEQPRWGRWTVSLSGMDMRRIGISLATRFCDGFTKDFQGDAKQHAQVA